MKGYWIIRTYEAGVVGEKTKYWVPGQRMTKSDRRMKTEIRKQAANEACATKRLARLLNANFRAGDGFLSLTYSDEAYRELQKGTEKLSEEEKMEAIKKAAKKKLELWRRRVSNVCKKVGAEFRYICVTSDMDGETGESVRIHHHVIVPAELAELCEKKWREGDTRKNKVWAEPDHYGLAKYLMDQVRRVPDEKKYTPSRNLIIPKAVDRVARGGKEVQAPKGAVILLRSEWKLGMPQYIRYILPPEKQKLRGAVT